MIDNGSQANLILENLVIQLGLETNLHLKPYLLGWVCKNAQLQVTKQCRVRFAINSHFIDGVVLDAIPLDICGLVLGSPYLFDRKSIFLMEHNMYHFFKNGIKYIVRVHKMTNDLTMVATGQMKMLVNASKGLSLMTIKDCGFGNELVNIDTI